MKRKILILATLVLFSFSHSALAATDTYFGLKAGVGIVSGEATLNYYGSHDYSDDFTQFGLGVVLGTTLSKMDNVNVRLEIENHMRFGSGEMEDTGLGENLEINFNNSTLLSLYLDFPVGDKVTPYIGVSAGFLIFSYEAKSQLTAFSYVKETGAGIVFQGGPSAGLAFMASDKVALDFNVRYLWSSSYNIDYDGSAANWDIDVKQNMADITLGFRYYF